MNQSHHSHVDRQFGPQADAYVASAVHAAGEDLEILAGIARREAPARALDLGTGGGHVAYRLSGIAGQVVACDLSAEMLAAVAASARDRGIGNLATRRAPAERLPFGDGEFDFLGCRFTSHHWRDLEAGLRESRRVLAPGKTAVFVDTAAPGRAVLDTHLQAVELLRDTSHVRNYRSGEWIAAVERAGFDVRSSRSLRLRLEFGSWIARMRAPELHVAAIRALQQAASDEVAAHFAIEADGSFTLDVLVLEAVAA